MRRTRLEFLLALPLLAVSPLTACGSTSPGGGPASGGTAAGGNAGLGGTGSGAGPAGGSQGLGGGAAATGGGTTGGAPTASGGTGPSSGGGGNSGGGPSSGGAGLGGGTPTGGTDAGGSPGAGGASADPCSTASLCDGFESGMDAGWSIQPNSTPAPVVDTTKGANGSASSLKVSVTSQQSFVVAVPPAESFYVRTYMMFENATSMASGHGWFIVGADSTSQGSGSQMRFGASTNHGHAETDFNVYGDTCGGEKTHFSDGANDAKQGWENTTDEKLNLDANKWYCVEAFFNGDNDEFQLFVDEQEHAGFHVTAANMCDGWAPEYKFIKLGGGANGNFGNIWYDDVVISKTRPHCATK